MEPRGRGRARGRARGQSQQQAGQQGPRPGPLPQGGHRPPPVVMPGRAPQPARPGQQPTWGPQGQASGGLPPAPSPWARAPHPQIPQAQPSTSWARPPVPAQVPLVQTGRGARRTAPGGGGDAEHVERVPGAPVAPVPEGGAEAAREGSGGVRGRKNRTDPTFVRTKPIDLQTKKGTSGYPIQLTANYFALLQAGKWTLYHYRVDFNPDVDNTAVKKSLVRTGLRGSNVQGYLFDGSSLFTPFRIIPDPLEVLVQTDSGENIRIQVRLVADVAWGDYHYLQLFNIIIRKCLTYMNFQLVSREYFDPHRKIPIPEHKLELWPGYYTSMRQHERDILLNCAVKFKVMRTDTVYDMMLECRGKNKREDFNMRVLNQVILTYYNNRTYKVDDVDYSRNPSSTFDLKDGTKVTFAQYYKQKYNINIRNMEQPLLISRAKPREIRSGMPENLVLIPELCQMTGLSEQQRENFQLMKALSDHTRVGPRKRIEKLREFSVRIRESEECLNELRRWDLNIADQLVRFAGRVMPEEMIIGGGSDVKFRAGEQADWTRELRTRKMLTYGKLNTMIVITPSRLAKQTDEFVKCLQRATQGMSWKIDTIKVLQINGDTHTHYIEQMNHALPKFKPDLVMFVLPNALLSRYSAIKKSTLCHIGIPSQVILAKNLTSKGVMSIATKVAIQINCKVGGGPWSVIIPLPNLMIVGYDVCRDTQNKSLSYGAMVASLDRQATRYYSFAIHHQQEQELSGNFCHYMVEACKRYRDVNGDIPERILIYRDGVGDGQLPYVVDQEVESIKRCLKAELYKDRDLRMTFVVVSKRIHSRIFHNGENPPPGTVVDDVITLPERYDFFIVSQCVRQGTVTPTSYNIIEDTMGLPPDRLQMLTYKLCHMYYNWSGTVRVPAPCQYAHKLAYMTAQILHQPPNTCLHTILFYL